MNIILKQHDNNQRNVLHKGGIIIKRKEIQFMALGGGQRVGASCYFLRLGENNILLDCGIGFEKSYRVNPVLNALFTIPEMYSLSQLSEIYISHAHLDHSGYLPELIKSVKHGKIYMTAATKIFLKNQYNDKNYLDIMHYNPRALPYSITDFEKYAATVNYMQQIPFKNYTAAFYEAGHIPGAMMVLFEYGGRKILYSGDYSLHETPLTGNCQIPDTDIDILILCGIHAKHPRHSAVSESLKYQKYEMLYYLNSGYNIYCYVPQLSKGVEMLTLLNTQLSEDINIYIDEKIYAVVGGLENLDRQILQKNNYCLSAQTPPSGRHIILSTRRRRSVPAWYKYINGDFSLHDSFDETIDFIKKVNPKIAVIVHSPGFDSPAVETVEQYLMFDAQCRTQFIFPEEQQLYILD